MSKKIISLLLVLILAGAIGFALYENKQVLDEAKAPKEMNLTVPVNIYTASYGFIGDSISKVGTLQPIEEIKVVSEGNGRITRLLFQEGSKVKAGQTLAVLDSDLQKAQLIAAEASYQKAEKDYKRLVGLLEKSTVSSAQVEQALLSYKSAESQYLIAKKQLKNMTITAGISGTVTKKHSNKGAFVSVGTPIADIVNTSTLELEVKLSEQDISKIQNGQTVDIFNELYPNDIFEGKVKYIAPVADKDRMYPIKLSLVNLPSKNLKAGMFATVGFDWQSDKELIMIPSQAIGGPASNPYVFVEASSSAKKTFIQTAGVNGSMTGVVAGLDAGDKVITTSITNLTDGSPVEVLKDQNSQIQGNTSPNPSLSSTSSGNAASNPKKTANKNAKAE